MFSRNRCNGQDGTAVPQYPRPKKKTSSPKRRQPNPKLLWCYVGKLTVSCRDLQIVLSSLLVFTMLEFEEEDEEEEEDVEKLQNYCRRGLASAEVCCSPHGVKRTWAGSVFWGSLCWGSGTNREGGIRIPCTLLPNSNSTVVQNQMTQDLNGSRFSSGRRLDGEPKDRRRLCSAG